MPSDCTHPIEVSVYKGNMISHWRTFTVETAVLCKVFLKSEGDF